MKVVRRTKIRFEKRELTRISVSPRASFFCRDCQEETAHLPLAQMAAMLGFAQKTVFRLAEIEEIHSTETANGQLFICAASAANFEK